jgi:hypothetical protein
LYAELRVLRRVVVDICEGEFPGRDAEADAVE